MFDAGLGDAGEEPGRAVSAFRATVFGGQRRRKRRRSRREAVGPRRCECSRVSIGLIDVGRFHWCPSVSFVSVGFIAVFLFRFRSPVWQECSSSVFCR